MTPEVREQVIKLCQGNPGALNVLMGLVNKGADISLLGPLTGSKIWVAFKDFSGSSLDTLIANLADPAFVQKVLTEGR